MSKKAPTFFEKNIIKIKEKIISLFYECLNLIFPPVCGICGKINRNWICENCQKRIEKIECFKSINFEKLKSNIFFEKEIQLETIYFNELLYCFKYSGVIRKIILKYKFNDCAYLYNFFSTIILKKEKCCRKLKDYDIIIPVPMYYKKKLQRGYNQTELIASKIANILEIQYKKNIVSKIKNTKTQSTLSLEERKQNIKNVFFVNNINSIKGKNIIIFDDIYTTGQTVNELSRILKSAGASKILIFVLAKD